MHRQTKDTLPKIGIDLLGSDQNPKNLLAECLPYLKAMASHAQFFLFTKKEHSFLIPKLSNCLLIDSSEEIRMDEEPLSTYRKKKLSSISLAMDALKEGKIDALISMGNTGALLAGATIQLKTLPSIKRPALLTIIPTKNKQTALLDVGGNTETDEKELLGFAAMGIAYKKALGVPNPTIALLNIGKEAVKGPSFLKKAHETLQKNYPFFYGNIEPNEAFLGSVDVLVTDGFSGNILLKGAEGIAQIIFEKITPYIPPEIKSLFNANAYPGALLCGVNGIIIKCHGSGDPKAIKEAIPKAIELVKKNFLEIMEKELLFCNLN